MDNREKAREKAIQLTKKYFDEFADTTEFLLPNVTKVISYYKLEHLLTKILNDNSNQLEAGGKTETEVRIDENRFWYDTLTEVYYNENISELSQQYILKIREAMEARICELAKDKSQRET